jgi:deoxynucleoside triphosphate triphosphohydrolase SAMHD1
LSREPAYADGCLCPLGEPKDSSAILAYYAEDVAPDFNLEVRSLVEALARPGPIVLVDDFIGSGSQSISIFEQLLGAERTVDLHEARAEPLPVSLREELLDRGVAVVFAGGTNEGRERLQTRLGELGLSAEVEVAVTDLPTVFDTGIFDSEAQRDRLLERCRTVAFELLRDDGAGHDDAWLRDKLLGYGDYGFLVIFPYNTPTQTLSALWAAGTVSGIPWAPLFPRRPKR